MFWAQLILLAMLFVEIVGGARMAGRDRPNRYIRELGIDSRVKESVWGYPPVLAERPACGEFKPRSQT